MIRTAFLRVYLPESEHRVRGLETAQQVAIAPFDAGYGIVGESMEENALAARWQGGRYVCPRTPRLRMLEGVLAVRRAYSQLGTGAVIPEEVARSAARELEALREEDPATRAYILTSAWHVPLRWFVPFDPSGKELVGRGAHNTIRYRVAYREAMDRIKRALEILGAADIPESIVAEVNELREWMNDFPADAMVELDYGTVGNSFEEMDLILDESVADIWEALEALDRGDWEGAGGAYGSLVTRWAIPMAVSYSN